MLLIFIRRSHQFYVIIQISDLDAEPDIENLIIKFDIHQTITYIAPSDTKRGGRVTWIYIDPPPQTFQPLQDACAAFNLPTPWKIPSQSSLFILGDQAHCLVIFPIKSRFSFIYERPNTKITRKFSNPHKFCQRPFYPYINLFFNQKHLIQVVLN